MATEPGHCSRRAETATSSSSVPARAAHAKSGRVIEGEARTITYAREHGYPVPEIHDVRAGGTEIVMERIEGPMMMDAMLREPWRMPRYCRELADLHDRLHVIPAPDWLPDMGGDRLVHLDLHPMNVMMTASGPVVIDWPNAARGDPLLDVGSPYILFTCPRPGSIWTVRGAPRATGVGRAFSATAAASSIASWCRRRGLKMPRHEHGTRRGGGDRARSAHTQAPTRRC